MIYVYFWEYGKGTWPELKKAIFCEKQFWDQNKYICDGYDNHYEEIVDAFERHEIYTVTDGEVEWEDSEFTVDDIKNMLAEDGILLLVNDAKFIAEFKQKFPD